MVLPPPPPSGRSPTDPAPHTTPAAASPPSRDQSAAPGHEQALQPLDPRVRVVWWLSGALASLQFVIPAALVDAVARPLGGGRLTLAVVLVCAVATAVVPPVRYRRWRYALREEDLLIRSGIWRVTTSVVPYRRLQFVDTRQGPLERWFGLAQLVVHTAALGTSGRVPGLDAQVAERLREHFARLQPDDDTV